MFDTSVVRAHAIAAPRRVTLLVSVVIHSVAVIGALALTVASTQIPQQPPRQLALYRQADPPVVPPPLGHPPRPHQQTAAARPKPQQALRQAAAPLVIPDQIPTVAPATTTIPDVPSTGPAGHDDPVDDAIGDPNGEKNSVGDLKAPAKVPPVYTPGAGVTSARVISRVEPRFPQAFVRGVPQATVVVLCIIGKDGTIRDAEIVRSSYAPFNDAVLTALNQWRFEPGRAHGEAVDTYFELTVRFQVTR